MHKRAMPKIDIAIFKLMKSVLKNVGMSLL